MEPPVAQPVPECLRCRELEARILVLETQLRDLEDRLKGPPPKRPVEPQPPAPKKKPTGKKRGAQPGHKPHLKSWLPAERVKEVVDHLPDFCAACSAKSRAFCSATAGAFTTSGTATSGNSVGRTSSRIGTRKSRGAKAKAKALGERWQAVQKSVFELWHLFRGGGCTRAVLWRRKSFGCNSATGCRFAERIVTVIQTLRLQKRNALEFLGQTLKAHRDGGAKPKLCTAG